MPIWSVCRDNPTNREAKPAHCLSLLNLFFLFESLKVYPSTLLNRFILKLPSSFRSLLRLEWGLVEPSGERSGSLEGVIDRQTGFRNFTCCNMSLVISGWLPVDRLCATDLSWKRLMNQKAIIHLFKEKS